MNTMEELELAVAQERRRMLILIVDDDRDQVNILSRRLNQLGYQTVVAHSGRQAVQVARRERPDLVLLDLMLPDTNGLQVCEQLADAPETCGTPVIIISGIDQSDIVRQARGAGCQYFVHKPYDPNALLILIRHSLDELADRTSIDLGDW